MTSFFQRNQLQQMDDDVEMQAMSSSRRDDREDQGIRLSIDSRIRTHFCDQVFEETMSMIDDASDREATKGNSKVLIVKLYDRKENEDESFMTQKAHYVKYEQFIAGPNLDLTAPHVAPLYFNAFWTLGKTLNNALILDADFVTMDNLIADIKAKYKKEAHKLIVECAVVLLGLPLRSSALPGLMPIVQSGVRIVKSFSEATLHRNLVHSHGSHANISHINRSNDVCANSENELATVLTGTFDVLAKPFLFIVRLKNACYIPEICKETPSRYIFLIMGPAKSVSYEELGRCLCSAVVDKDFQSNLQVAGSNKKLVDGLNEYLSDALVLPPGEISNKRLIDTNLIKAQAKKRGFEKETEKAKKRERRSHDSASMPSEDEASKSDSNGVFSGAISDIKNRYRHYSTDYTDAFKNMGKMLSTVCYMFLACITPAVTFGGLFERYTDGAMGMIETLFAQMFCGVIFAVLAAQPLVIVTSTGPALIFEVGLYRLCIMYGFDFHTIRLYTGFFVFLYTLILTTFNGAKLLRYVTRFTEEIFTALISCIFVTESGIFLYYTFLENPPVGIAYYFQQNLNCAMLNTPHNITDQSEDVLPPCDFSQPNSFFLTAAVLLFTFIFAIGCRHIQQSFWLCRQVRNLFGDYGVALAVAGSKLLVCLFSGIYIQTLQMPEDWNFTNNAARGHSFIIIPKDFSFEHIFFSAVVGFLAFLLISVETGLTENLLDRKQMLLVKGTGKNFDIALVGFCDFLCTLFGLPMMCAGAVQSIAHCRSLTIFEKLAPGEAPKPVSVVEQRVTAIILSLLVGAFAFFGKHLVIPTAALFGVFIYFGMMNLTGLQLMTRIKILAMSTKHHHNEPYVKAVSATKIRLFTGLQLVIIAILIGVKWRPVLAPTFPFWLLACIVLRQVLLPAVLSPKELTALDGEDNEEEESDDVYCKVAISL